jgi:multimeric flavodoxin WrbA
VTATEPRKGMPERRLGRQEFIRRFRDQFQGPSFDEIGSQLERVAEAAWQEYHAHRKSPRTTKAGPEFANPDYDLAVDWVAARDAIRAAQARHDDRNGPARILLINCSSRTEHTCPSEMSKSWRLVEIARDVLRDRAEIEVLDLSRLSSEYGRHIHPCKACFSTAPALCHWPCSCYPNYSLGQTQDWMNDIYPMWVAAHGIMIVTPVNWYQVSSPLKLMMDRLVCADGGNPDPTLTNGKDARRAKEIELAGGTIPATSKGGCSRSSCTATSRGRRTCADRSPTGSASCTFARRDRARSSTAISATGSLMRPVTTSSIPIPPSRTKSGTPPTPCWRRFSRNGLAGSSTPAAASRRHARNDA